MEHINTTRIALAVRPTLMRQLLAEAIATQMDLELVASVDDPVSLLAAVHRHEVDVVVCGWDSELDVANTCTHLLTEFPELRVVSLRPEADQIRTYRMAISVDRAPAGTIDAVLASIRKHRLPAGARSGPTS